MGDDDEEEEDDDDDEENVDEDEKEDDGSGDGDDDDDDDDDCGYDGGDDGDCDESSESKIPELRASGIAISKFQLEFRKSKHPRLHVFKVLFGTLDVLLLQADLHLAVQHRSPNTSWPQLGQEPRSKRFLSKLWSKCWFVDRG